MAIPNITGGASTIPAPTVQENDKVVGVEKEPGNMLEILPNKPQIYNTQYNNNVLHYDTDIDMINSLKGYIEGTPIKVDFFHQISGRGTDNSNLSTVSFLSDSINLSYLRIVGMEIRLKEALTFNYNTETNTSEVTTTAITYPGFIPTVGDVFVYSIDNGTTGLFKVNDTPQRLSIANLTSHTFSCTLIKILNTTDLNNILDRVRETAYFNKKRFLSEHSALLTHQEIVDLDIINKTIFQLTDHYGAMFYNKIDSTIWRPDDIYDPYMVLFLHKTIGRYINNRFIMQLNNNDVEQSSAWRFSLFHKLLFRDNLNDLVNTCIVDSVEYSGYSSNINSLLNRDMVTLITADDTEHDTEDHIDYINTNILSINTDGYTSFDKIISLLLNYGIVAYDLVREMSDTIRGEEKLEQFYKTPILIYLLKLIKRSIETGKSLKYTVEDIPIYLDIKFTSEAYKEAEFDDSDTWDDVQLWNDISTFVFETNNGKVVGIITDDGTILYPRDQDISYIGSLAELDIQAVMDEYGISEINGIWKIVITNSLLNSEE